MNPRYAFVLQLLGAGFVIAVLAAMFPLVLKFVEAGARELRYLWWLVLLLLIALWLIFGVRGRK